MLYTQADELQGTLASPCAPACIPSKFAVIAMTKQMAMGYAKDRIHVNAVCPGFVETPTIRHITADEQIAANVAVRHPWNAHGRPEDIADAALFLCSDESAWIKGHSLVVVGAYTRPSDGLAEESNWVSL
ncbi:hypothetical protein AC579_7664 [Pseudocercospora musae]|uniref:Uncharacterized protein n=1 Tax=Pseudocercospora musae TaxID=113226 RepID=A0A139I262_9PEZI|nr:hypothetical protein AC579_7664 [Pseudocercospora musae]